MYSSIHAQQLLVRNVDLTNFPQIALELYSFDSNGRPQPLDPLQDRLVTERLQTVRQTLGSVNCPGTLELIPTTAVLALDWASQAVRDMAAPLIQGWWQNAPAGSQLGLVAIGTRAYLLCDLTADTTKLLQCLEQLPPLETAQIANAMLDTLLGPFVIGARGVHRRCIVIVSEHLFPSTLPQRLIDLVQQTQSRLIVVALHQMIPSWLRQVCRESGGIAIAGVSPDAARRIGGIVAAIASGYTPCTLSWQSIYECTRERSARFDAPSRNTHVEFNYVLASNQLPRLDVSPSFRDIGNVPIGTTPPQEIMLTALNTDITLLNLSVDPNVQIVEGALSAPLLLRAGERYRIRAALQVETQQRTVGAVRIVSTACNSTHVALIAANTAEPPTGEPQFLRPVEDTTVVFAGTPLRIQWIGALPTDSVTLLVRQPSDPAWSVLASDLVESEFVWTPMQPGLYYLLLQSRRWPLAIRSGMVDVRPPPFSLSTPIIPPVRAGTTIEVTPPEFLCSDTTVTIQLDSVVLRTGESFQLARAIPGTIPGAGCTTFAIRFNPRQAGIHRDTLVVYTPLGTQQILLEGLAQQAQILLPNTIVLPPVPLGAQQDTLVQWLLCVMQPQRVELFPTGPDTAQLQLLTIRQFSLTEETPCLAYPFRLHGTQQGRTCLRLLIDGDESQPYECVLVGEVVCSQPYAGAMLMMPQTIITQTGTVIRVPVWMPSVPQFFRTMDRPYRFHVRCNATVLLPEPPLERGTIIDGERVITVRGRGFVSGDTLAVLRFGTYWGNSPQSTIRIENFEWLDECPLPLAATTTMVTMTDYCTAGGSTRLFLSDSTVYIESVDPQPSDGSLTLQLRSEQSIPVELRLFDMLGTVRHEQSLNILQGSATYQLHFSVPNGQYILLLRSPAGSCSTVVLVAR